MDALDMNLLPALDALLAEGSVTGAARRLGECFRHEPDSRAAPLLVRAGRGLAPTPHAASS
jgi:DNA-binding transcriptional LysR family regulator